MPLLLEQRHSMAKTVLECMREQIIEAENKLDRYDLVYFFTWNPNDKFSGYLDYNTKWLKMYDTLRHLRRCCKKFAIVPEISDAGRLHCHGWLVLEDMVNWKKNMIPKLWKGGFFKISKQIHKKKGFSYYTKELLDTIQVLDVPYYPITYDTIPIINKCLKLDDEQKKLPMYRSQDITTFFNK